MIYLFVLAFIEGVGAASIYFGSLNFTEPAFVFVILSVCSTAPILKLAEKMIDLTSRVLPFSKPMAFFVVALIVGPLMGSLITEPAAMTVVALVLLRRFYSRELTKQLMYATLGLLFVNISVGGTLTSFAAPPILMVAGPWNWDTAFMMAHFGWRGILTCVVSTLWTAFYFRREISELDWAVPAAEVVRTPAWLYVVHLLFLAAVVMASHHPLIFLLLFVAFFIFFRLSGKFQQRLSLREGLLVGIFLAGLVVLGGPQKWWLQPLLTSLGADALFWGATALTAVTDNAALTYLGAQVPNLSEMAKFALVSGAVVGGGLTVVANAPNPAGYGILNPAFGADGIHPLRLFLGALPPTMIAALCYWLI